MIGQHDQTGAMDGAVIGAPPNLDGLAGLRVLIVEDELLVSMLLADLLEDFGCAVAGQAATVGEALERIETGEAFDAAILDVNIGGEKVFPVADLLCARKAPFVFSTGYGPADLAQRYPGRPLLFKPYQPSALAVVLGGFVEAA